MQAWAAGGGGGGGAEGGAGEGDAADARALAAALRELRRAHEALSETHGTQHRVTRGVARLLCETDLAMQGAGALR